MKINLLLADSCTLELDLPDLTKLKEELQKKRKSLPQHLVTEETERATSSRDNQTQIGEDREELHGFRQVSDLSSGKDGLNEVH